jgi:hypothetical protein
MADVFISYKNERRNAAQHLARIFELNGFSVWFDYGLLSGTDFGRQIEREIRAAKAVLVLWCRLSRDSAWVLEEAHLAQRLGTLMPAWLERIDLPLGFARADTIDLSMWDGAPRSHALDRLLSEIARRVGRDPVHQFRGLREYEEAWRSFGAPSLANFNLSTPVAAQEEKRLPTAKAADTKQEITLPVQKGAPPDGVRAKTDHDHAKAFYKEARAPVRPRDHEIYLVTDVDTDIILKEIKAHYGGHGDVRTTRQDDPNNPDDEVLMVQIYKDTQSVLPIIEILSREWANEIVAPHLSHLWGPGRIIYETALYGVRHQFLYERHAPNVLGFDKETAKRCFNHLVETNSQLLVDVKCTNWWHYLQFRLLIYVLLLHHEHEFLISHLSRKDLERSLQNGLSHTMEHCLMAGLGTGDYAHNSYHHEALTAFDELFEARGLSLELSTSERLAVLRSMAQNGGHQYVSAAIKALSGD